jgi:hypothetical protein
MTLVGASVGAACQCLIKTTANHDSDCCCPMDSPATAAVPANTCHDTCVIGQRKAPVGEILTVPDSSSVATLPVSVTAAHYAFASTRVPAPFVEAPPLALSSLHPILRI